MSDESKALAQFDEIVRAGNRPGADGRPSNWIKCTDGFKVSVLAHGGAYCSPRPPIEDLLGKRTPPRRGPFTALEVGYPSERPEPWDEWVKYIDGDEASDPTQSVYGYVPVPIVRALIESHEVTA
jgi:hypothetical protein